MPAPDAAPHKQRYITTTTQLHNAAHAQQHRITQQFRKHGLSRCWLVAGGNYCKATRMGCDCNDFVFTCASRLQAAGLPVRSGLAPALHDTCHAAHATCHAALQPLRNCCHAMRRKAMRGMTLRSGADARDSAARCALCGAQLSALPTAELGCAALLCAEVPTQSARMRHQHRGSSSRQAC